MGRTIKGLKAFYRIIMIKHCLANIILVLGLGIGSLATYGALSPMQVKTVNGEIQIHSPAVYPRLQLPSSKEQLPKQKLAKQVLPLAQQIWNLKDADIQAVIQTIALLTGKNFIIDPRVTGKVTLISQQPMTIDEMYHVFLSLLQVLNYAAVPVGHVIKVVPAMNASQLSTPIATSVHPGRDDEVVVRVVPIYNTSAAQLVPVLRPLMQEWESISAYIPSNALILVGSANNIQRLVSLVRGMDQADLNSISVIGLRYASAKQLVSTISDLQAADRAQGKISNYSIVADSENNSILVSGNLENQMMLRSLIRRLDTPQAIGSNTVVVHLNYLEAKNLAPILTKIAHGVLEEQTKDKGKGEQTTAVAVSGNPQIAIQPEENSNAIVIHAPQSVITSLRNVIRQLDMRPQEVLVQAIIVRVDENLLNQLGIVWNTIDSSGRVTGPTDNSGVIKFFHGIGFIQGGNLQAIIHLLAQNGSSDILATPSVAVLNNQQASIADGENVGILNRQYSTSELDQQDQVVPFNTFERKDVTLTLKVTPQISPNNMLRLKIEQTDDNIDPRTSDPENPVIDTSKITTHVLVRSGDILVLGGLIDNDLQKTIEKIPILGDIPIVGNLFRFKNHNYEKKNLMVFIRPIILHNNHKARTVTLKNYNYMRYQQIKMQTGGELSIKDLPILPKITRSSRVDLPAPSGTAVHNKNFLLLPAPRLHAKEKM